MYAWAIPFGGGGMVILQMSSEVLKHSIEIGTSGAVEGLFLVGTIVSDDIGQNACLTLSVLHIAININF